MIQPDALQWLRCPLDPAREANLVLDDEKLFCSRCWVRFQTPEGIPNLIADEAILPDGCSRPEQLPCRKPSGK
jgi:uncharacterized protein YbaR (Trm112 family)